MTPKDNKKTYTPGKKVFDVTRPGKTPAQPGARPVIPSRQTVDDPDVSTKRSLMNPKQKITISPTDDSTKKQEPVTKPRPKEPAGPPPVKTSAAPSIGVSIQSRDKSETKPAQTEPPKADGVEQPIVKTEPSTYEEPARKPAEPTYRERVEPMHMGMPQEFSPSSAIVSQHGRRRTLWLEILSALIILVLLAAIINLLLDAEIIKTNLDIPYTNFFDAV